MHKIKYIKFSDLNIDDLVLILNEDRLRNHLVSHPVFDSGNINEWVESKIVYDASLMCRTRGIIVKNKLVGWCGIQESNSDYELAIVLSESYWGLGPLIFKDILQWAKELGHQEIVIHLLDTRPEYKFLKKVSSKISKTKMLNREFTTYHVPV